ncbi:septation protein SepH [Agrococcus sp. ARC_14]|uniref:septation protein SepH n=1 Tax=Agrococcus sp. ARC_14 TaxID=2919927 RepID=UPI001F05BEBD|nr:septation protein SepH [Agrococcus sp. ARC_14]MCH1883017.1 septation protein SepH [Agrococcus sp. ARC_14]
MQQLSVIGVEDDVLILESESGERFRVPVDALPEHRKPAVAIPHRERKATPRDIQSLIRGGMTAEEVASSTGEELAYIERFEGPVVAERNHVLASALSIPVATGDIDPLAGETTFGAAIDERLDDLRASERSWAAWKDGDSGVWTVRLRFTTEAIQHEATWGYEPKKATLTPRSKEATSLSQTGDASSVLVPRLRAIDRQSRPSTPDAASTAPSAAPAPVDEAGPPPISQRAAARERASVDAARTDTGRFDSDAFRIQRGTARSAPEPVEPGVGLEEAIESSASTEAPVDDRAKEPTKADNPWLRIRGGEVGSQPENVQAAAINRPAASAQPNHTAELLDALRRRRTEREAALRTAEAEPSLFEVEPEAPATPVAEPAAEEQRPQRANGTGPVGSRKRGSRASMPSWDEIVFGSRTDD